MHDGFQEAQAANMAKTSNEALIEPIVHRFVSEVESVRDSMTMIGLNKSAKATPEPQMETDVFGDTVTQPKESMPVVEIKKGKQIIIIL